MMGNEDIGFQSTTMHRCMSDFPTMTTAAETTFVACCSSGCIQSDNLIKSERSQSWTQTPPSLKMLSSFSFALLAILVMSAHILLEFKFCYGFTAMTRKIQHVRPSSSALSMVSLSGNNNKNKVGLASDSFLKEYFNSDISDVNLPPSLNIVRRSLTHLASGSDIRGQFVATPPAAKGSRSFAALAQAIGQSNLPALTPFAAHCLGFAFASMVKEELQQQYDNEDIVICLGRDPREHGSVLADAFSRGAGGVGVKIVYTGIATTPALFEFCR